MAALLAIAVLVLSGAVLAGTIGPLARDSEGVAGDDPEVPAAADEDGAPTASPIGVDMPPAVLVTVDLHPVGPLDPEELPITRVIGAPEVVPFPTPFDRSVRLAGVATGLCLPASSPPEGGAASTAFDLHLGRAGTTGWLTVSLPATGDGAPIALRLDLAMLGELDREGWHRLTVTADGRAGRVEAVPVGGGGPVLESELSIDAAVSTSSNEVCVQSSLQTVEAALFIDNLRIDG